MLFLLVISCSKDISNSKYYFIQNKELIAINIQNDTLYEYKCEMNFECFEKVHKSYKIIKSKEEKNLLLIAVEQTNFVPNASKEMKKNRLSIIGVEKLSSSKIKFTHENTYYNKKEITKLPFKLDLVKDKFGFTFYEEKYLKSLPTDFEIDVETSEAIIYAVENSYHELYESYQRSNVRDTYRTGILSEVIVRELIKRYLSPADFTNKFEKAHQKSLEQFQVTNFI
ncbi:hypothetical protein [Kordia sp.]|uniref:hypothetical protein n=1 Tax=Kordia sp. TaxID=1965332 RepID=UPI0025BB600A|nr:hypothetical protein [Kordia sp.]MCH2194072.1 hypothetical protein [Kordia sp.]